MGLYDRIYKNSPATAGAGTASTDPTILEAVPGKVVSARSSDEVWGRPGRCPKCGGIGYLDRVDVIDRIQFEHCTECSHKWSVAEAETVAAS